MVQEHVTSLWLQIGRRKKEKEKKEEKKKKTSKRTDSGHTNNNYINLGEEDTHTEQREKQK